MKKRYVKPLDGNCKGVKTNLLKRKRLIAFATVTALAAGALTACKTESGPTETADLNGGVSAHNLYQYQQDVNGWAPQRADAPAAQPAEGGGTQ